MRRNTSYLLAGLFLIIISAQSSLAETNVVIKRSGIFGAKSEGSPYIVMRSAGIQATGTNTVDIEESKAYCDSLIASGYVEKGSCEPNYQYHSKAVPNDPQWSQQYAHSRTSLPAAWDITVGSANVRIAIIDTGVDATHPDLAPNIYVNPSEPIDGIDNDGNGFIDDRSGWDFVFSDNLPSDLNDHGTHCAGIAAGAGNNSVGIAGGSWNSTILPIRVLDAEGSGFLSDIAAGVRYAADNGAQVLSLSLGGPSGSDILRDALSYACSKGKFIAVAAGNESSNNDSTPAFPANYDLPCLVSVAASDSSDNHADFSNFGASKVHFAAPGVDILSTLPGNRYGFLSGTSMATPLVAGIAALVKAAKTDLSGNDIKTVLMNSVDQVGQMSGLSISGGRVNANNAIALATGTTPTPPNPPNPPSDPGTDPGAGTQTIEVDQAYVNSRKVVVSGYLSADDEPVEGTEVYVDCRTRRRSQAGVQGVSRVTDDEGYFRLQFGKRIAARLIKGGICYLSTLSTTTQTVARLRSR
jgi:subtilisin family serine protease